MVIVLSTMEIVKFLLLVDFMVLSIHISINLQIQHTNKKQQQKNDMKYIDVFKYKNPQSKHFFPTETKKTNFCEVIIPWYKYVLYKYITDVFQKHFD